MRGFLISDWREERRPGGIATDHVDKTLIEGMHAGLHAIERCEVVLNAAETVAKCGSPFPQSNEKPIRELVAALRESAREERLIDKGRSRTVRLQAHKPPVALPRAPPENVQDVCVPGVDGTGVDQALDSALAQPVRQHRQRQQAFQAILTQTEGSRGGKNAPAFPPGEIM